MTQVSHIPDLFWAPVERIAILPQFSFSSELWRIVIISQKIGEEQYNMSSFCRQDIHMEYPYSDSGFDLNQNFNQSLCWGWNTKMISTGPTATACTWLLPQTSLGLIKCQQLMLQTSFLFFLLTDGQSQTNREMHSLKLSWYMSLSWLASPEGLVHK